MATPLVRTTHPNRVLAVLFAGAFVMGCAEMLVVGLLDLIADDLTVSSSAVVAAAAAVLIAALRVLPAIPAERESRAVGEAKHAFSPKVLAVLHIFGGNPILVALAVLGVGLFAMGMAPSLQYRVVELAGPGGALAASLPASAVNAGIALGAFAGGRAIDLGGVPATVVTGLVIAATAVAAAWATSLLTVAAPAAPLPRKERSLCA